MRRVLVAVAVLSSACPPTAPAEAVAAPPEVDAGLEWVRATEATGQVVLEAPARVVGSPRSSALVMAPLRASISAIRVRAGDRVDAGAPLLDVVMPELLEAAGRFEGAQLRLTAWSERARSLAALKAEGLSRASDVSEAQAKEAEARADLQVARATLLVAGYRERDVAGLLGGAGTTTLRAPVGGVVTEVAVSLGESREPSSGALVSVVGEGPLRVEARFSRPPPEGGFTFVTSRGSTALTEVSRAHAADPRDGTFVLWLEASPDAGLAAGTLGRVALDAQHQAGVLSVPARALRRGQGLTTVATASGPVTVEVLQCGDGACLVRGRLKAGDQLAIEGAR